MDERRTGQLWPALAARLEPGERLLLALSGGGDSVALLLLALPPEPQRDRLVIGHVHHGTGAPADEAEALVRTLCEERGLTCAVQRVQVDEAEQRRVGFEAAARRVRYEALDRIAAEQGCTLKLTAHTRDDQAETVLLALLRGAGTGALAGIRRERADGWLRPLLDVGRGELREFLRREGARWVEDPANREQSHDRVRLREQLAPRIREQFGEPGWRNIAAASEQLLSAHEAVNQQAARAYAAVTRGALPGWISIDAQALARYFAPDVASRVLALAWAHAAGRGEDASALSRRQRRRLERLVDEGQDGLRYTLKGVELVVGQAAVRFDGHAHAEPLSWSLPGELELPDGTRLRASVEKAAGDALELPAPGDALFDAESVGEGLTVRPWRPGDRFHPIGRSGMQPVTRALRRAPGERIGPLWVAEDAAGEIVWVVGERIAEMARITERTRRAWRLVVIAPARVDTATSPQGRTGV